MPSTITLKSSDDETFEVEESVAVMCLTIKQVLGHIRSGNVYRCPASPNITGNILAKVIDYCKKHSSDEDNFKVWDEEFVKVDQTTLYHLMIAAHYLEVKSLIDLTCRAFVKLLKGQTPEDIRKRFNIKDDFTPEQKEVQQENLWTFQRS